MCVCVSARVCVHDFVNWHFYFWLWLLTFSSTISENSWCFFNNLLSTPPMSSALHFKHTCVRQTYQSQRLIFGVFVNCSLLDFFRTEPLGVPFCWTGGRLTSGTLQSLSSQNLDYRAHCAPCLFQTTIFMCRCVILVHASLCVPMCVGAHACVLLHGCVLLHVEVWGQCWESSLVSLHLILWSRVSIKPRAWWWG